ncbi:hypothetical protein [Flaviflexus huanghaiensis]|uniref:hypothetical protein n=1 Tax=Flaviflexus huanghaiensis TaxID=1111473 RepID=UPI0015FB63B4|nr:hypothetical protein [Flaviflexus huanghaiensis]
MTPLPFFRKKRTPDVSAPSPQSPPEPVAEKEPAHPEPEVDPFGPAIEARRQPTDSEESYAAVTEAFAAWRSTLAEKSSDIVLSPNEPDVVDLSHIHPTGAAGFYAGSSTPLTSLFREADALSTARTKINTLLSRQRNLEESYGSAPISLIHGTLTWTEIRPGQRTVPDTGSEDVELGAAFDETGQIPLDQIEEEAEPTGPQIIEITEPALRRSVHIATSTASDPVVTLGEGTDVSSAVLDGLRRYGAPTDAVEEVRRLARSAETQEAALVRLREIARVYLPGCVFEAGTLLALASSPSAILHDDLIAMEPQVRASTFIADLVLGRSPEAEITRNPYDRSPQAERGAGQLDVSELDIVEAVAEGTSVFIDAAPGTDVRRVLASIAADRAASQKHVIYVYGSSAAHHSFTSQLERLQLGEALADFSTISEVPLRLRAGLRQKSPVLDSEAATERNAQLEADRERLAEFMSALHETSPKWGVSAHQLLIQIAEMSLEEGGSVTKIRLGESVVGQLADEERRGEAASLLDEALRLDARASQANPWAGSTIYSDEQAAAIHERVTHVADISLPALMDQVQRAAAETGLRRAESLDAWAAQLELLSDVSDTLDTFRPHIYERSVTDMIIATASKEWRNEHGAVMKMSERRRLKKEARDMVRPGQEVPDLHTALSQVQREREKWRLHSEPGSWPSIPDGVDQLRGTYGDVRAEVDELADVLPDGGELTSMSLIDLRKRCQALARESGDLADLPRRNELRKQIDTSGLTELFDDLRQRDVNPERAGTELYAAYLASVFELMFSTTPALAAGAGSRANDLVASVVRQDREHVGSMPDYISRAIIASMRATITKKKDETLEVDAVLAEHDAAGLREAIAKHGDILRAARPIWAMSAVTVAQYIPPMEWADLVILDGIDSIELAQLVPSLLRGRTVVACGRAQGLGEAVSALSQALPVASLPTHSSRHDEITARFLADNDFSPNLRVYPGAPTRPAPRLIVVEGTGVPSPRSGLVEGPEKEVDAVVEAVVDLALSRPEESIGVIALNAVHAERIRTAARAVARTSSALAALTDPTVREPFAVVDALSAGTLRRDHIILTVGLGKTVHGRVLHSFGNLSTEAGVEGLVSALEAPRKSLTVISSFEASDIDRSRLGAPGSILLVDLLEAFRHNRATTAEDTQPMALIADLVARLRDRGYDAKAGYSRSGSLPIPLVAGHPDIPGTWAVAVTLDDETYAAEKSLRRRDQFWPAMLSERGWRVVPTVTTSVFFEPQNEVNRIIAAVDAVRDDVREAAAHARTSRPLPAHLDTDTIDDDLDHERLPRGPRPKVSPGMPLAAYSDDQLDELVTWIMSDGIYRSEDEVVEELRSELDLRRRGIQVDVVLRNVVRRQTAGPSTKPEL